jgi:signal peptidase I
VDPAEGDSSTGAIEAGPDDAEDVDDAEAGEAGEEAGDRKPTSATVRSAVEWAVVVVGALVVAFVVKTFLFQAFYIPSESMEPTLDVGDRVLVNKLSYDAHDVNRGDLVVFVRPAGDPAFGPTETEDLIKRVIGLPGETIEARDGVVYVDGRRLEEPYLVDGIPTENLPAQEVPVGHVFVMGDNRTNSEDSRVFGAVDEGLIVGRAFVRVWPLDDLSLL